MIVHDGAVRHKSLNEYTLLAQFMQDLYEKIQVRQISSQEGEIIVEIDPEFVNRPQVITSLEERGRRAGAGIDHLCGSHVPTSRGLDLLEKDHDRK